MKVQLFSASQEKTFRNLLSGSLKTEQSKQPNVQGSDVFVTSNNKAGQGPASNFLTIMS